MNFNYCIYLSIYIWIFEIWRIDLDLGSAPTALLVASFQTFFFKISIRFEFLISKTSREFCSTFHCLLINIDIVYCICRVSKMCIQMNRKATKPQPFRFSSLYHVLYIFMKKYKRGLNIKCIIWHMNLTLKNFNIFYRFNIAPNDSKIVLWFSGICSILVWFQNFEQSWRRWNNFKRHEKFAYHWSVYS